MWRFSFSLIRFDLYAEHFVGGLYYSSTHASLEHHCILYNVAGDKERAADSLVRGPGYYLCLLSRSHALIKSSAVTLFISTGLGARRTSRHGIVAGRCLRSRDSPQMPLTRRQRLEGFLSTARQAPAAWRRRGFSLSLSLSLYFILLFFVYHIFFIFILNFRIILLLWKNGYDTIIPTVITNVIFYSFSVFIQIFSSRHEICICSCERNILTYKLIYLHSLIAFLAASFHILCIY